jgi:nicotinate-nucleotide adenylyltransferase
VTARSGPDLPPFGDRRPRRIGLLGGSFNPAHDGHIHLTREALRALGLHQVWWLVSPQNPLKAAAGMAPFAARLAGAETALAQAGLGRRVLATGLEGRLGVTRTAETLALLRARYPGAAFVWLMGADNLAEIPRWWRWTGIFRADRVAVFDRSPYSYRALAGAAAIRFSHARRLAKTLWAHTPPAWSYIAMRRHPASATALRLAAKANRTKP